MIMDIFPCSNENYRARGSIKQEFITDAKRRRACKIARIKTLAKKAHELEVMCGSQVIIHHSDPASNTYVYCAKETWEGYSDSVSAGKPAIPVKSSKTISHLDEDGESSATLTNHGKKWKVKVVQGSPPPATQTLSEADITLSEDPAHPTPSKTSMGDVNFLHQVPVVPPINWDEPLELEIATPESSNAAVSKSVITAPPIQGSTDSQNAGIKDMSERSKRKKRTVLDSRKRIKDYVKSKLKRTITATSQCHFCDANYSVETDSEDHCDGSWIGCETCDTWAHRKCAGFTVNDVKTRDWKCSKCIWKFPMTNFSYGSDNWTVFVSLASFYGYW